MTHSYPQYHPFIAILSVAATCFTWSRTKIPASLPRRAKVSVSPTLCYDTWDNVNSGCTNLEFYNCYLEAVLVDSFSTVLWTMTTTKAMKITQMPQSTCHGIVANCDNIYFVGNAAPLKCLIPHSTARLSAAMSFRLSVPAGTFRIYGYLLSAAASRSSSSSFGTGPSAAATRSSVQTSTLVSLSQRHRTCVKCVVKRVRGDGVGVQRDANIPLRLWWASTGDFDEKDAFLN